MFCDPVTMKLPRARVLVHESLHVRQELGGPLDLVQDHRVAPPEKTPGIGDGPGPHVGHLERGVAVAGEDGSHEGRLPRLPGPGDGHDGVLLGRPSKRGREVSGDHGGSVAASSHRVKLMTQSSA